MPQLDKYIFFHQIVYLTFFFFLLYIYIRKQVVPKISTILKFRKKKMQLLNVQLEGYNKVFKFAKVTWDVKGKAFINVLFGLISHRNSYYNDKALLNTENYSANVWVRTSTDIEKFSRRSSKELERITLIVKQ